MLSEAGAALAEAVEAALPGWVERSVRDLLVAFAGRADPTALEQAREAGRRAAAAVGPELRRLLAAAGVPPVVRDEYDEAHFPGDVYGLTPRTFTDVDPSLRDVALVWGAAKARASMIRHS